MLDTRKSLKMGIHIRYFGEWLEKENTFTTKETYHRLTFLTFLFHQNASCTTMILQCNIRMKKHIAVIFHKHIPKAMHAYCYLQSLRNEEKKEAH